MGSWDHRHPFSFTQPSLPHQKRNPSTWDPSTSSPTSQPTLERYTKVRDGGVQGERAQPHASIQHTHTQRPARGGPQEPQSHQVLHRKRTPAIAEKCVCTRTLLHIQRPRTHAQAKYGQGKAKDSVCGHTTSSGPFPVGASMAAWSLAKPWAAPAPRAIIGLAPSHIHCAASPPH